jgi:hypothetical protein
MLDSYNQEDFLAIVEPTMWGQDITLNGRQGWYPLECLLDAYIDMFELEKVQAISDDIEYVSGPDKQDPWIIHDYSEPIVQRTVKALNELVQSIESQLPASATVSPDEAGSSFLADEVTLSAAGIDGFASEFFSMAKSPQFKYIAPGISIQTSTQLKDQPYRTMPTEEGDINTILLFRGDRIVTNLGGIFYPPSKDITKYPSELYLQPCGRHGANTFEDVTTFVLPFTIGVAGWTKASDYSLIGEGRGEDIAIAKDLQYQLYSPGYNAFIEGHGTQLYRIQKTG